MRLSRLLAPFLAVSLLALAGSASAQTPRAKDDNYTYRFEDERLVGDTLSSTPPLLLVRPRFQTATLIRPRAHFVAEMLKSVEAL